MKILRQRYLLLLTIVVIGFLLRILDLGVVPGSLEWDEVAIGYDSYSLLKTGKDQFNQLLPLTFRSLDDWKPPLYEYLAILPTTLFNLNPFSVRLPSALMGTLAVFLTYYLVEVTLRYSSSFASKNRKSIGLFASLFTAISPWHLQFSRAAFEVNIAVTILTAAVVCFFIAIYQKGKLLSCSSIFFGLAIFSYHSARIVTPIILVSLLILFRNQLKSLNNKKLILSGLIITLFVIFFLPLAFSKEAQIRFSATNILYYRQVGDVFVPGIPEQESAQKRLLDDQTGITASGKILHNRRIAFMDYEFVTIFLKNYLAHFHPEFLFVRGDAPLHHAPDYGMLHPWDAFFLPIGILIFIRKMFTRTSTILILWLLVAPTPAAVTWQIPHSVRTELFLPAIHIFSAIGVTSIIYFLSREYKKLSVGISSLFFLVLLFNLLTYLHQYYAHTNFEVAHEWLYGRKEAAEYAEEIKGKYKQIVVSTKLEQPHVFFLFYIKYSPFDYQKFGGTVSGGFLEDRNHFDSYVFKPINYEDMQRQPHQLLIGKPEEFPPNARPLKIITLPNGREEIQIVET